MKIVNLQAENIKRLVAVEIAPDGNMVEITGRNGAGKTSVLDSIFWVLAGTKPHQSKPIRQGQTEARIRLDLGEIVVKRTFRDVGGGKVTTRVTVETPAGAKWGSPQTMLDDLLGTLTFDPLAFARMDATRQYDALKTLCGLDLDALAAANRDDYRERTDWNRAAHERRAAAAQIGIPEDAPTEAVDVAGLVAQISAGEETNRDRSAFLHDVARREERAATRDREAEVGARRAAGLRREADLLDVAAAAKSAEAEKERGFIREMGDPPEAFDPGPIQARIGDAQRINGLLAQREQRDRFLAEAAEAEKSAEALTKRMEERTAEAKAAVEAADMPVDGLSLDEGRVVYNDLPFDQASDAEQLRVSCAMAMRDNATLKVIRVRDGSLLDEDSLRVLGEMADAADYQVWIERVDTSGKVGFVIEDGMVKS